MPSVVTGWTWLLGKLIMTDAGQPLEVIAFSAAYVTPCELLQTLLVSVLWR